MFSGFGEEECTRFGKKSDKKRIDLISAKSGLVGMKGYLKTYNLVKYFLLHLNFFLNETAFYTKLLGQFLGSETELT